MSTTTPNARRPLLSDRDHYHVTRSGWLPRGTGFAFLDRARDEHERLLALLSEKIAAHSALTERYAAEDEAQHAALVASYRSGDDPQAVSLTSDEDRRAANDAALLGWRAAAEAVVAHGTDVVAALQGEPPADWHASDAVNSHRTPPAGEAAAIVAELDERRAVRGTRIAELQRELTELYALERVDQPFRVWIVRNSNAGLDRPGLVQPAGDGFELPPTHSAGTKPRSMPEQAAGWPAGWETGASPTGNEMQDLGAVPERGLEPQKPLRQPTNAVTVPDDLAEMGVFDEDEDRFAEASDSFADLEADNPGAKE